MRTPARSVPPVRLRLLGDYDLVVNGTSRARDFPYDKPRLLLAVLAMAQGRSMTRTELAELLWPADDGRGDARARLRHALFVLRHVFEDLPDALVIEPSRLALRVSCFDVDVWDVLDFPADRQLDPAVRLDAYRGPLLDTITLSAGDALAAWRQGWQARIDIELAQCRTQLASTLASRGETALALEYAKRWVELWPDDEAGHRHLIRLLLTSGNRDAALRAYEHCVHILRERQGIAPHTETQALLGLDTRLAAESYSGHVDTDRVSQPLAVLKVVVTWPSSDPHGVETAIDALQSTREHIRDLARQRGAWMESGNEGNPTLYFGYPEMTERPIVGALDLAETLAGLSVPNGVCLGMALHADAALVVPGPRPDAGGLMRQQASQLAWLAQPGEVLLTLGARERIEGWRTHSCRRHDREAWILDTRHEARPVRRMFGRSREFDNLVHQWAHLAPGRAPTALVVRGQPGIGKTLLANSMVEYVRQTGGEVQILACREGQRTAPWRPLQEWLTGRLHELAPRVVGRDPVAATQEVLQRHFGLKPDAASVVIELATDASAALTTLAADRRVLLIETLAGMLLHQSPPIQPFLLVWENLHWAHEPTFELLDYLVRRICRAQTMVLTTSRDAFEHLWPARELTLKPLERMEIAQLVAQQTKTLKIPRRLHGRIVENSAGVPFYVDEMLRQCSLLREMDYAPSLADIITVRLSRQDEPVRRLARWVALEDGVIDAPVLATLLDVKEPMLDGMLDALSEAGLLAQADHARPGGHVLVAQAVRRSMTPRERRAQHLTLAQALMEASRTDPARYARRIAQHLQEAGDARAPGWWQQAATAALALGKPQDALPMIERALDGTQVSGPEAPGARFEFDCRLLQCAVLGVLEGSGAPATLAASLRAVALCPEDDLEAAFESQWGCWLAYHGHGDSSEAQHVADRLMRLAVESGLPMHRGAALLASGIGQIWLGDPVKAVRLLRQAGQALTLATPRDMPFAAFGMHPAGLAYCMLGWALALQNEHDEALSFAEQAVRVAGESGSTVGLAITMLMQARVHVLRGEGMLAARMGHAVANLTNMAGLVALQAMGNAYALLLDPQHNPTTVQAEMAPVMALARTRMPTMQSELLALSARAMLTMDRPGEALTCLQQATELATHFGIRYIGSELLCLLGDTHDALGESAQARDCWEQASTQGQRLGLICHATWAAQRLEAVTPG